MPHGNGVAVTDAAKGEEEVHVSVESELVAKRLYAHSEVFTVAAAAGPRFLEGLPVVAALALVSHAAEDGPAHRIRFGG